MDILALDFDGVICDSAAEAAVSGWKSAVRLWPGRFAGDAPGEMIDNFRLVRPVMETGYESILLVRLLRDGCTVGDILQNSYRLFSDLIRDALISREQLVSLFGQTRDAWMASDMQGWLEMHDFYDGVADALNGSHWPLYIITTKEKRFAQSLCRHAAIRIPEEKIFGLESGKKQHVLAQLSRQHEGGRIHFLEDRITTLKRMIDGSGYDLRLYFAQWGYHTDGEAREAENIHKIITLTQDQFPDFVKMPSNFIDDEPKRQS